jgi:hypothetical protein
MLVKDNLAVRMGREQRSDLAFALNGIGCAPSAQI